MIGTFGFSYVGLIFLACLYIPNMLFAKNPPKDVLKFKENKLLLAFERAGQALCSVLVLIFSDYNVHKLGLWSLWLGASAVLMLLYLLCWCRYFTGEHKTIDFLRPFLGIPIPMAILPVAAVLLLSVYGKVLLLTIAGVILGIGHIGITAQNLAAYNKADKTK